MARFSMPVSTGAPGPVGPTGLMGETGPPGLDGADALWNFLGEYNNGADYNIGDVVTYSGGTYYRILPANPGYPPGTTYWTTIAEAGAVGATGPIGLTGATGPAGVAVETSFVVMGGTTGPGSVQPTFNGAPLFTGTYIKIGPWVAFQIQVDFSNILTFGSGQYYINLPFTSKYAYQFRSGSLQDPEADFRWSISGQVLSGSNQMKLFYNAASGKDEIFDYNSPHVLDTTNDFYISGNYIDI